VKEYTTLVANHSNTLSTEPLHKRLASIPLNAWEDELPSVDLVIRETLRSTLSTVLYRRNLQKDIVVDGVTIKRGDFMALPVLEAHMNPNIYSNPSSFDPDRFLEGREEDKKETFAYFAWGAGATNFDLHSDPKVIAFVFRAPPVYWDEDSETGNEAHPRAHAPQFQL